jgi:hypothetical protein
MIGKQEDEEHFNEGTKRNHRKEYENDIQSSEDSDITTQSTAVEEEDGDDQKVPARVNNDEPSTRKMRKKVWSKLLDNFPTGGDETSKTEWLAKVLFVSDKNLDRDDIRLDVQPEDETKEMAAEYLESANRPRKKQRRAGV